jgi:hypothetical protein
VSGPAATLGEPGREVHVHHGAPTARAALPLLLCALALAGVGCSKSTAPGETPPVADTSPARDTPAGAVRLLEWSWKNRGIDHYREIFTDDYRFLFAEADSAGNAYRDVPYIREDELSMADNLFVGNADHATASDIQVDFDRTMIPLNDDRPGKSPKWHKSIRTGVDLKVAIDRGSGPEVWEVHGYAKFYVVRGDSAEIPADLAARGFGSDTTRWWIDRWEDETLPVGAPSGPAHANPTANRTWGGIKSLFR